MGLNSERLEQRDRIRFLELIRDYAEIREPDVATFRGDADTTMIRRTKVGITFL